MLAIIWLRGSIIIFLSTSINISSAIAMFNPPPHTRVPRTFFAIFFISSGLRSTGARTSIVSAVPAGLVIALLLVLGMSIPVDATVGTASNATLLLPGTPPMLCSSYTGSSNSTTSLA